MATANQSFRASPPLAVPPRKRVLRLEPVGRTAAAVGRVLSLADDAFEPELARVMEDGSGCRLRGALARFRGEG
jgi:hypothetical protein